MVNFIFIVLVSVKKVKMNIKLSEFDQETPQPPSADKKWHRKEETQSTNKRFSTELSE